jgi:hypothetical protein
MHNTPGNISIERFGKNNLADLGTLFYAVHGRKVTPDFFSKKYDTGYTGVEYLGFIAYSQGHMPVAFYGVIPCYLCYDGELLLSAQSADTMTHPAFRNRGLFVKLAGMTVDLCKEHKLHWLFGFPNQHSLPGFVNKLGWEIKANMDCFIIPAKAGKTGKLLRKFSFLQDIYKRYQRSILDKNALATSAKPYGLFANEGRGVWRNSEYILYRQYNCNRFICLSHALVWIKAGDGLVIGDMLVEPEDFDATITTLCMIAGKMGLNKVIFHSTKNARLHALFAGRCIPIPSFPVIFKDLSGGRANKDFSFTYADVDTF